MRPWRWQASSSPRQAARDRKRRRAVRRCATMRSPAPQSKTGQDGSETRRQGEKAMNKQFRAKTIWMAGVLSVIMAAGTQAVVQEAARESGEVIQPKTIHAGEPFTFAVSGSINGEVVDIKTV